jgi:hypothetical protein
MPTLIRGVLDIKRLRNSSFNKKIQFEIKKIAVLRIRNVYPGYHTVSKKRFRIPNPDERI